MELFPKKKKHIQLSVKHVMQNLTKVPQVFGIITTNFIGLKMDLSLVIMDHLNQRKY